MCFCCCNFPMELFKFFVRHVVVFRISKVKGGDCFLSYLNSNVLSVLSSMIIHQLQRHGSMNAKKNKKHRFDNEGSSSGIQNRKANFMKLIFWKGNTVREKGSYIDHNLIFLTPETVKGYVKRANTVSRDLGGGSTHQKRMVHTDSANLLSRLLPGKKTDVFGGASSRISVFFVLFLHT